MVNCRYLFFICHNQKCLAVFVVLNSTALFTLAENAWVRWVQSWQPLEKESDFSVGSCTSVCLVLYSTSCQACFLLVAAFCLSFLKQSRFRSVCFLELWGNWEFPLWGCKINLVLNWDKFSLPPSSPLTEFFRKKNVLHFLWRGRQERLELLHGESDRFQGCSGGSELPSWAGKCQYWCSEASPVEKESRNYRGGEILCCRHLILG